MPVTITPLPPLNAVGPGLAINASVIGPVPDGWSWDLYIATDADITQINFYQRIPAQQAPFITWFPWVYWQYLAQFSLAWPVEGSNVWVSVRLVDAQAAVHESGTVQLPWRGQAGLGAQNYLQSNQIAANAGFTTSDRTLANQTNDLVEQLLTLTNVVEAAVTTTVATASGTIATPISDFFRWIQHELFEPRELAAETCDRIDAHIPGGNYFSVRLEITQHPPEWIFRTPDQAWGFSDLAVLSFWSGDQLLQRHGVHALQHTVSPLPGTVWWGGPIAQAPLQWGDYHITVDFAPGVCGRLTGDHWPL